MMETWCALKYAQLLFYLEIRQIVSALETDRLFDKWVKLRRNMKSLLNFEYIQKMSLAMTSYVSSHINSLKVIKGGQIRK